MSRVYECVQWNEVTQSCDAALFIERASFYAALPTVEQAQQVGGLLFGSIVALAAMSLLFPSRSYSDD